VRNSASNVVVAVIDTGVRYSHEDLVANMWTNSADGSFGWNALTATNNPSDENGHGTLVAGVLGAVGNNGVGISGVAWRVRIMACRALGSFGIGNVSDIITCLDYARTNGVAIINASWGLNEPSDSLSNAVYSLREAGIILVAACGNSANDIDTIPIYPASYPFDNIVSVAFTTRNDALAATSSFGATRVDLAAPGEQIISTFGATDNFYYSSSGSSLAAPHVSGALALMLARFPGETHQQIIARLLASVDPLPSLAGKCVTGGRLNLRRALSPDIRLTPQPGSPAVVAVAAGPNRQCVTQYSTNLVDWVSFTTNTTTSGGTFQFTNAFVVSPVFFRATAAP
jgi:subtilisin family serine protease